MKSAKHNTHQRHAGDLDEVEHLVKKPESQMIAMNDNHQNNIITHSASKINYDHDSKLGADTFAGAAMIIVGTTMYGIFGILSRLSMLGNKTTPYQSAAAMVVAEFGKFVVSLFLLFNAEGIGQAINSLKLVPYREWFLFSLPAALYSITNNLDFYILQYMDPGSMQVLIQTKIITTALLWWWWFKKLIDKQQWVSLIMLCSGSMLVAWPEEQYGDNNNNPSNHSMYVEWPMGPIFVGIQICLSAVAGVYTEWVYKKYGRSRSIHIDNLSMYFWGTLSNSIQFFIMNSNKDPLAHNLFYGFNYWTWLLIIVYVIKGLCIAQIMKYFSNIVKLFMTGASIIVSGCLTFFVFGLNWTMPYVLGLMCVTGAVLLYKSKKKWIS